MNSIRVAGKATILLLLCCIIGCRTQVEQPVTSDGESLPLALALLKESDLGSDWHWYYNKDAPTTTNRSTQTQGTPIETTSRGFRGYWQIRTNDVLVGHVLRRYAEQTPPIPEITSADLLDYQEALFYAPEIVKVGKAQSAKCAPVPGGLTRPPAFACKVIVQYDHILSIIQITSQVGMREQVEVVINQILEETDPRIQQIAQDK